MSEASKGLGVSSGCNKLGPDYFGFYAREVAELLSQDEDFLSLESSDLDGIVHKVLTDKDMTEHDHYLKMKQSCNGSGSIFCDAVGFGLSDFKKERLKALLRQSIVAFTQEVDEVLDPVLSMRQIQSYLRCKKSLLSYSSTTCESDVANRPCKKQKFPTSSSPVSSTQHGSSLSRGDITEVNDDLRYLLENDSTKLEETMKKYSDELLRMLSHMEKKIEELLDIVMSTRRTMAHDEKQLLQRFIERLPLRNLDRVVGIVQRNKPSKDYSTEEVFVDLDKEDNVTLWRLYYYVKTVENARKLCEA